ncbi:chemotaxis protein CheX [Geomesophilobacter sediminis]|uniref:Chemotaxis protein CheX n=1 Tax=Geomesophilobacter sediminis TaxID=2798584 RepID=A0A8J7M0J6_9BACT|nr:chemotaxis protein CheX [Geomesophilobacter sediminis]MBJ6725532.1 chemotaxis protein CheX [Geomesophilobacter sediminis]
MAVNSHILSQLNTSEEQLLAHLDTDVQEIFSTMVGVEVAPVPVEGLAAGQFHCCVSGLICLSGACIGTVGVHLPPAVAMEVTSMMLGMDVSSVDNDVTDAVGEIANMVAGSFKHHIIMDGHELRITPPTVIACNEHLRTPHPEEVLALSYQLGAGNILVTVNLEDWE